jgi:hypothetical protein
MQAVPKLSTPKLALIFAALAALGGIGWYIWGSGEEITYRTADVQRENPLMRSSLVGLAAGWVDRARGGTGAHLVTWTRSSEWPEARERRVPLQDYAANLDLMARG